MGYSYTGKGEILDKLTPEDHSGWGLEKAANFIREQRENTITQKEMGISGRG